MGLCFSNLILVGKWEAIHDPRVMGEQMTAIFSALHSNKVKMFTLRCLESLLKVFPSIKRHALFCHVKRQYTIINIIIYAKP